MSDHFIHRNGGGTIVGTESAVGSDCRVQSGCLVTGRSRISYQSTVLQNSVIDSSSLALAAVSHSAIVRSDVVSATVRDCLLTDVIVRGTDKHWPKLEGVTLSGGAVIEGDVRLSGLWSLDVPILIHAGKWERPPRHYLLAPPGGMKLVISECTEGRAHVGCACRPIDTWIDRKERLRRVFAKRNWQGWEVDLIHSLFMEWT